jgi:hypothetical protein
MLSPDNGLQKGRYPYFLIGGPMNGGMPGVQEWLTALKAFGDWDSLGGSATQTSSRVAEDYFQKVTEESFPDAWVRKLSSQERMDFAIGPKAEREAILSGVKRLGGNNPTEYRLRQWQANPENRSKVQFIFVQVKTGDEGFTLNDTFPPPEEDLVYAFFDYGSGLVSVTTSAYMAEAWKSTPPIVERYRASVLAERQFDEDLHRIWKDTPVGTAARPTYRIGAEYATNEPPIQTFVELFGKAGVLLR